MSVRTPDQNEAIGWYVERHKVIPQLSAHPVYYFRLKRGGGEIKKHIADIMAEWRKAKK